MGFYLIEKPYPKLVRLQILVKFDLLYPPPPPNEETGFAPLIFVYLNLFQRNKL